MNPSEPFCIRTCALEICLTDGCWLRQVAVRDTVEAPLRLLAEEGARHREACRDPRCRHFVHHVDPGDLSQERVA